MMMTMTIDDDDYVDDDVNDDDVMVQQAYPKMLSQGVYASYCEAFVDSITRFDDQFKDKITTLVHRWFTGMPGLHLNQSIRPEFIVVTQHWTLTW